MPQIPTLVTGTININREEVINLLLASIAMEELGLAHIINAEAEKVQAVLGTLPGAPASVQASTFNDLITIDGSVRRVLRSVIKKEMLLQFKLEDIISLLPTSTLAPIPPTNIEIELLAPLPGVGPTPGIICFGGITGKVTNNGHPLEGAVVTLELSGPAADENRVIVTPIVNPTDSMGRFEFKLDILKPTPLKNLGVVAVVNVYGQEFRSELIQTDVLCIA